MHARELVEVAALAATQGRALIVGGARLPRTSIEDYWVNSKCRLGRWARSLKAFRSAAQAGPPGNNPIGELAWRAARPVLEEIFTGEILTRLWSGVLCAYDVRDSASDAGPVARSVMLGHLEVRQRALALVADRRCVGVKEATALARVRRRSERWSDFLLGSLLHVHDVTAFAVDADRLRDFADQLHDREAHPGGKQAWTLALASLRSAFKKGLCPYPANGDVNARIASSILACLACETFESTALFRSLWLVRLDNMTRDVEGMVEELLQEEARS